MHFKKQKTKKEINSLTDSQVAQRVATDINAYKYLIDRYESKLLRYIQRILYIPKEDAEDILQEVFLKAYRNINGYDPKYKFSNWIYRIAHNEAVSFLRKKKIVTESNEDEEIFDTIPSDINIEDEFVNELKRKEVKELLSKLDTKYREVLILRFFEEMEYNEIAEVLHISSGTVASLISRGKEKFKMLVQRYGRNI